MNYLLQVPPRAMGALLYAAPCQDAEEAFRQGDPGGVRGSMVKVHLGMAPQPALGGGILVDIQIVQNHVHFPLREVPHHLLPKAQEVDGSAPLFHLGQNLTTGNLQSRHLIVSDPVLAHRSLPYVFLARTSVAFRLKSNCFLFCLTGFLTCRALISGMHTLEIFDGVL